MTKTIEEQIVEAREERDALAFVMSEDHWQGCPERRDIARRIVARAASRLATLEAVRDGRMMPVFATVCANSPFVWEAHGWFGADPTDECVLGKASYVHGDAVTVLRGYAHVPSAQVHEVEAEVES